MKKLMLLLALLTIAAFPALAQFPNYHYQQNMNCSDCHSMHASAHNNLTDGTAITEPNAASGTDANAINPYYPVQPSNGRHYLLKAADVCESCHEGKAFAPDVYGENSNTYIRSAGGVRPHGVTTGGGHQVGSTVRPPGYDGTSVNGYFGDGSTLECYSCHSPHGGTAFRNLGPYQMRSTLTFAAAANVLPTVAKSATFDSTKDVTINATTRTWGADLPGYYGRDKVAYSRKADGSEVTFNSVKASNRYDHFCGVCHGNFHGGEVTATTVGDGTNFIKHPTSMELLLSAGHGTDVFTLQKGPQTLKVYQAAGTISSATDSPGCVSCHKAHGNNNPFALIYPDRATGTVPSEEGGGVYRDLCKTCHPMGG